MQTETENVATAPTEQRTPRTLGLRLIIAYKLVKAPVMLVLAIWLTVAPNEAYHVAVRIVHELSAASALWVRLGHWIEEHLSTRLFRWGAVLAWLDFITTSLEAILLIMGKPWGEWLVTIGLAALLVPELFSLEHRPSWARFFVLLVNAAVVVYLGTRRIRAVRAERAARSTTSKT
ncbi:MAG TPA: DUF2127 domain-containing protein [Myxococcaceae bacterium]|nr:DUF2127 domain-containing protein [Myxococcaceae bacterium]